MSVGTRQATLGAFYHSHSKKPLKRLVVAVLIGLVCSVALWIVAPYHNAVLFSGKASIADDYLPVGPIFIILVLVLAANPLIRRFRPGWALTRGQLATALAIMLVAAVIPGQGLMRMLPYMVAKDPIDVNGNKLLSEQYQKMHLPDGMFPDKLERGGKTPAGDRFTHRLRPGEDSSAAWDAWLKGPANRFPPGQGKEPWYARVTGPVVIWGLFVLFGWMMMLGLSVIVLPQWRDNERLAFPLLAVHGALIEDPGPGKWLAPIFRRRTFWAAAGAVFLLHLLSGLNVYMPERVPAIPLKWNLSQLFSEEPLRYFPVYFHTGQIFFAFVGLAFFMPNRIGFSVWFFTAAWAVYRMLGIAYHPPFQHGASADYRTGAMLAMTVAILWLGRAQWGRVARLMFRGVGHWALGIGHWGRKQGKAPPLSKAQSPMPNSQRPMPDSRNLRDSGWLFLLGLAGMFGWLVWLGLPALWACGLVAFAFMVSLLITRVVAETGMPFMRLHADAVYLMKLAPMNWVSPISLFLASVVTILFPTASRANVSAMAVQGMALAEQRVPGHREKDGEDSSTCPGVSASRRPGVSFHRLFLAVLVLGFFVAGASHVWMNYHNDAGLDGKEINTFGAGQFTAVNKSLEEVSRGDLSRPTQNVAGHIAFGVVLAGLLYWLSMTIPTWPLHPIGLLLLDTPSYGDKVWVSVLVGWVLKNMVVRFGGTMGYRLARPVFLGVIMGEVFAAVFFGVAQLVLVGQGVTLKIIEVLPG